MATCAHGFLCSRGLFYMPHSYLNKFIKKNTHTHNKRDKKRAQQLDVTALWIGLDGNEAKCRNLKATFLYSQEENSTPTHSFVAKKMTHDRVTMIHEHINVGNKPINSLFSYNAGGWTQDRTSITDHYSYSQHKSQIKGKKKTHTVPVSGSFPWLLGCPLYSKQRLILLLRIGKEVYWRVVGIFACQLGCADGKMLGGVHPHACLSCLVCAAGHRLGHTACLCANHTCKELGRPGVQCVPLIRDGNGTDFFRYPSHPTPNGTGFNFNKRVWDGYKIFF